MSRTSPTLPEKVRQNDSGAWERLVSLYTPLVYYWCKIAGLQRPDAEEVGQEVFLAVAASLKTFSHDREGARFRGWLAVPRPTPGVPVELVCDLRIAASPTGGPRRLEATSPRTWESTALCAPGRRRRAGHAAAHSTYSVLVRSVSRSVPKARNQSLPSEPVSVSAVPSS